ncbi:MAG: efflux transporter outer membrane subunit [Terriglobia bacterium]|nr:efflux transporter outer membrane subunit [Terriglobia bacterium]
MTLSGCAVGPDFKKPAPPDVSGYTQQPLATIGSVDAPGGDAQRFDIGKDISGDWWTVFHSKPLNLLVDEALKNNSDLKAAQAALNSSRESVLAQRGAFFPSVSAGISATREQDPSGALAPVPSNNAFLYNLYTPQVSVSYMPDVFGLNRRTAESLTAQEKAVRFQLFATYTTLTSNVVVTAIQIASTDDQIAATRELIDADSKMVDILEEQLKKGYASGLDMAAQRSQLASAQAALPPLMKQSAQLHDLMAVLTGHFPSEAPQVEFTLASLTLPQDLPISIPSKLVEQRPDIGQAEENLHSASAQIGIAVANRLPNFQITAGAGSEALKWSQLFTPGTEFWNLGASLTAPIFQGGQLLHQERAARANYEQAAQQYRSTVLAAFQNVADTLTALQQDAEELKSAAVADKAAKDTLDLTERQVRDGYSGGLQLFTAEQAYQQAHIALVQAQADRYADTAALFQALGGGWWHRTDLARNDHDN